MYIYAVSTYFDKFEISRYEVIKDTEKQYQVKGNKNIKKSMIGCTDSYGYSYELSEDKAISVAVENINKSIEQHKNAIERLEKKLQSSIEKHF